MQLHPAIPWMHADHLLFIPLQRNNEHCYRTPENMAGNRGTGNGSVNTHQRQSTDNIVVKKLEDTAGETQGSTGHYSLTPSQRES
jgi:hypothetical protein